MLPGAPKLEWVERSSWDERERLGQGFRQLARLAALPGWLPMKLGRQSLWVFSKADTCVHNILKQSYMYNVYYYIYTYTYIYIYIHILSLYIYIYTYVLYICIMHVCVFVSTFPCYDQIIVKFAYRYLDVYFAPSTFLGLSGSVPKRGIFPRVGSQPAFSIVQCTADALPMHLSKWARSLCWCSESDCQLCQVFSVSWVYYRSW